MSKSNAFYVGSSKGNVSQPFSDKGLSWPQTLVKYLGVNVPITNFDNNLLFNENFPGITREVQTLLNIWSSRGLTLMGKITILKSLVIPKIVYKATYLPITLSEIFIKELNQIMYKFIWGSKWEKIGRSQLCCDVKEGDGKMIDIKQYVLSLRFNFIFELFGNNYQSSWKSLEHRCIDENVLFCILRSTVKLNSMLVGRVAFLRFTLTTLRTLKHVNNIDNDSKYLWFNKAVKYRNQPMFVEEFCKAGIFDFFQLLNSDFELYSYDKVASAFHMIPTNTSFIKYIKFISAIPMAWITTTNSNSHEPSCTFSDFKQTVKQQITALGSSSKTAYKFLKDQVKVLPVKQQLKWCGILQLPSDAIDWSTIFKNNYYATNATKLRSFQIRLNLRSIVTNIQLHVLDIASDNLCTFCREEPETLIHLFYDCKIVDAFWNNVFDWILARFRINVPSNNFHAQYVNNPLVNLMLLSARFLIYRCKHSKTTPNMPQYFNAITSTKKSEHYIAKKHNKLQFHYKK